MAPTQLICRPLDRVLEQHAQALQGLGAQGARKVLARALNYETKKGLTQVRRALRKQSSIPMAVVSKSTSTRLARPTGAGTLEAVITGRGRELPLSLFRPRQFKAGTKATVWGKRQTFPGGFMGPRPGLIATKLKGESFHRAGSSRLPIKMMFGPSVAKEIVKDQAEVEYEAISLRLADRVGKEIAAHMRGY